jgi:hypothetical protein
MGNNSSAPRPAKAGPVSAASVDVASRDQTGTVTMPTEACRRALFSVAKEQVRENTPCPLAIPLATTPCIY